MCYHGYRYLSTYKRAVPCPLEEAVDNNMDLNGITCTLLYAYTRIKTECTRIEKYHLWDILPEVVVTISFNFLIFPYHRCALTLVHLHRLVILVPFKHLVCLHT